MHSSSQLSKQVGLALTLTATSPLQMIKYRLQTMQELIALGRINTTYNGVLDCIAKIKSTEGVTAFWKGNAIGLLRFFPNQSINFNAKDAVKQILPASCASNVLAGVIGGWTGALALYPLDNIRLHVANSVDKSISVFESVKTSIRKQGLSYLYQGLRSSLLSIALYRGSYFGIFDSVKTQGEGSISKSVKAYLTSLTAGMLVFPLDTIRRKKLMLNSQQSEVKLGLTLIKQKGIRSLFQGSKIQLVQSIASSGILLYFDSLRDQEY